MQYSVGTSPDNVDCSVELMAIHQSSDVIIQPAESKQTTSEDVKGNDYEYLRC